MKKKKVLFLCTHNSARSQMAEGLLRHFHGDNYKAYSAGTEATQVKPEAVQVLAELGIDISKQESKTLERYLEMELDYVVTVCDKAKEACPFFPGGKERVHRRFFDPSDVEGFRKVRDEIRAWIEEMFG